MFESISTHRPNWMLRIAAAAVIVALGAGVVSLWRMTQMPLRSYKGRLPSLSVAQSGLANRLTEHVKYLSVTIGERNIQQAGSLQASTDYLRRNLVQAGYAVTEQCYSFEGQSLMPAEPISQPLLKSIPVGPAFTVLSEDPRWNILRK